jgi:hypothetical protein
MAKRRRVGRPSSLAGLRPFPPEEPHDSKVQALGALLLATAQHQAARTGWTFSPSCWEHHVEPLLRDAALRMAQAGQADELNHVSAAEAAVRHMVSQMTLVALSGGLPDLREETFKSFRERFCPCFPIC